MSGANFTRPATSTIVMIIRIAAVIIMAFFLTIFSPNIDRSVTITNIAIEPTAIGSPRY